MQPGQQIKNLVSSSGNVFAGVAYSWLLDTAHLPTSGPVIFSHIFPTYLPMDADVVMAIGWQRLYDTSSMPYDYSFTLDSINVFYDTIEALPVPLNAVARQSNDYRYGYNGQMKNDEYAGRGHHYDALYWEYDPRTARRGNRDPKGNAFESYYSVLSDNPITNIDPNGDRSFIYYRDYVNYAQKSKIKVLGEADIWKQGHWLSEDVKYKFLDFGMPTFNDRYLNAARINTQHCASDEYTNLNERREYYAAVDGMTRSAGFEVRWMAGAVKTVGTLNWALSPGAEVIRKANPEIRAFIRNGNKAILDDMMPRIRALTQMAIPLTGENAQNWDMQTLADEQHLIQAYYDRLSPESISTLQKNLESAYDFTGNILNAADRWSLGMKMMGYQGMTPNKMPPPAATK